MHVGSKFTFLILITIFIVPKSRITFEFSTHLQITITWHRILINTSLAIEFSISIPTLMLPNGVLIKARLVISYYFRSVRCGIIDSLHLVAILTRLIIYSAFLLRFNPGTATNPTTDQT